MNYTFELDYLDLLGYILDEGEDRADRTGTGTKAIFGMSLNIDLAEGFPILTTKKIPFRAVASELLWFIEGSGDERRLAELLHGTRDLEKRTIWSPNADATTGAVYQPKFYGDLGRVYGVQWRSWHSARLVDHKDYLKHDDETTTYFDAKVQFKEVDQLLDLVHGLKTNPTGRRHVLTAWNPGELDQMVLPPCHMFAQFYLSNDRKLLCQMYQRSVDTFLGLPFNISSYALLTHLIAHCIEADVGTLTMVLGDTHIYSNHIEQVETQLRREPGELPQLLIKTDNRSIDGFKLDDLELVGYNPMDAIKAPMAA